MKQNIDKLLTIGFIQLVEKTMWLSPIMVIPKKNGKLVINGDFRKLNVKTKKDPFPLPFIDEVLNIVARCEAYSFLDGYYRYHQISIVPKDIYKITFVIDWNLFICRVMPFGMKNELPTFQRIMTKDIKKYLDSFMKIFLNEFTLYSDMDTHL